VTKIGELENRLNNFDSEVRMEALSGLVEMVQRGEISLPPAKPEVNIHIHSFFSFNALGWSPSRIAWEGRKYGLEVVGIVDFDVLDGLVEFLQAGDALGIKAVVGMESRVFVSELADVVTNSPNEPGIHYFMLQGCYIDNHALCCDRVMQRLRDTARSRNIGIMNRVNDYLRNVRIDYEEDVLPLTPSGNATERHLLAAYDKKSREILGDKVHEFWAEVLGIDPEKSAELMKNTPAFHDAVRSKLMKFGGVGYAAPDPESFPSLEDVIGLAQRIGAVPTTTWLDGTNEGEQDMMANLELFTRKGAAALNIIPDRNWNIKDPDEKAVKTAKLKEAVDAAREFGLPLSIGTEMNKAGQPFVDDFSASELACYVEDFLCGARFFYGHTLLARCGGRGFGSEWAKAAFGGDRRAANRFYMEVGRAAQPSRTILDAIAGLPDDAEPADIIRIVSG